MTINIFMHIYIGENAHWDIYAPPWQNHYTIFFSNFLYIFFHFRCILLQISHKKCFFISISILGRSGVKLSNCHNLVVRAACCVNFKGDRHTLSIQTGHKT